MKGLISTLILLWACTYCNAQGSLPEFAPYGATWVYESIDYMDNPLGEHTLAHMTVLDHDTIVEGKTCRIFSMDGFIRFFAYKDSLQIWVHINDTSQHWQLLFDFGWMPGQVVNIPASIGGSMQLTVSAVTDTVINNDTLPVINFQDSLGVVIGQSPVIMNIGMTSNYFIPQYGSVPEEGPPTVRCYNDTVIGTYKAPGVVVCDTDFRLAIPVVTTSNNSVHLYPNPTNGSFALVTKGYYGKATITVTDIVGREIKYLKYDFDDSDHVNIDLTGRAPGIYIVQITSIQGINQVLQVVKE